MSGRWHQFSLRDVLSVSTFVTMSGIGSLSFFSNSSWPTPDPQYVYYNGGTRAFDSRFGNVAWDAQALGNEVVFAKRPAASEP